MTESLTLLFELFKQNSRHRPSGFLLVSAARTEKQLEMVRSETARNELMLMKRFGGEFMSDMEEQGSVLAMDVDDDIEPLELCGETIHLQDSYKLDDRDFFNSFADDFDDAEI